MQHTKFLLNISALSWV